MKVPKSIAFPLVIDELAMNSLEVQDQNGDLILLIHNEDDDISDENRKMGEWIVRTLNKAANDS